MVRSRSAVQFCAWAPQIMKLALVFIIIAVAAVAVYLFLPRKQPAVEFLGQVGPDQYQSIVSDLQNRITEVSPTPPTESRWTVRVVEFAQNSDLAYITYHDTHNLFRILVRIGRRGGSYHYKLEAAFEKSESGWRKTFGEDLAIGKLLIKAK